MRVSREQAEVNRQRVVSNAIHLFRAQGIDSVSIADVMKASDLTHGGFYKQFDSKQALVEEACTRGLEDSVTAIFNRAALSPEDALNQVIKAYLSDRHCSHAGEGCTLAAMAGDAGRGSPSLQDVFVKGITGMANALSDVAGEGSASARAATGAVYPDFSRVANLVGAITLARAVRKANPELAAHILNGMIQQLTTKDVAA